MEPLSNNLILSLFSAVSSQSSGRESLANGALSRGIDLYLKGNYDGSVREFRRVVGLSPGSDNSLKAYDYMASAFLRLNKTENAISAYKDSIKMFPTRDSTHMNLGNLYFSQGRYQEAEKEYQSAVRMNPGSVVNLFSLGQAYLASGKYDQAETVFTKVAAQEPRDYGSYYALGQTYYKQGEYEKAVEYFQKTIELNKDFAYAYLDLGYAYADLGRKEDARSQGEILNTIDPGLAGVLDAYLYQVSLPQFLSAYSEDGFDQFLGPGTPVASLGSSLSSADASQDFSMTFIFDKGMDALSVQNPANWRISRSTNGGIGGVYNWGLPISQTEVEIAPVPQRVIYDSTNLTAEVTFSITQNSSADGTLDPSHIVFRFYGKDVYGNSMDPASDEYSGISKIV